MRMSLANNIREIRRSRKLSQEHVAEQLGVSRQAVSKWESGQSQPNANNLAELAKLLEVPLTRLTDCNTDETDVSRQGKLHLPKNYDVMVVGAYSGAALLHPHLLSGHISYPDHRECVFLRDHSGVLCSVCKIHPLSS